MLCLNVKEIFGVKEKKFWPLHLYYIFLLPILHPYPESHALQGLGLPQWLWLQMLSEAGIVGLSELSMEYLCLRQMFPRALHGNFSLPSSLFLSPLTTLFINKICIWIHTLFLFFLPVFRINDNVRQEFLRMINNRIIK